MDQRRRRAGGYNPSVAANRQQSSDARWSSALRDVDGNVDPAIQPTHHEQRPPWRSNMEVPGSFAKGHGRAGGSGGSAQQQQSNRQKAGITYRNASWEPIPLMEVEPEPPPLRRRRPSAYEKKNYDNHGRLRAQMGTGMKQLREQLEAVSKEVSIRVAQQQEAFDANASLAKRLTEVRANVDANTLSGADAVKELQDGLSELGALHDGLSARLRAKDHDEERLKEAKEAKGQLGEAIADAEALFEHLSGSLHKVRKSPPCTRYFNHSFRILAQIHFFLFFFVFFSVVVVSFTRFGRKMRGWRATTPWP